MNNNKCRGIYRKFVVSRTDGKSEPGEKHYRCEYFVLDVDHDPHARPALLAYADSCQSKYPKLAEDVRQMAAGVKFFAPNGPKSNVTVENRDGEDMSTLTIEQCRGIVELVLLRARSSTNPATMEHLTEMVQERVDLCLREEPGTGDLA